MTALSVTALFAVQTAAQIFETGLQVARVIGLPVTSWRTGDPTRSLYKYLAEVLAELETVNASFIKSGFLSAAIADAEETGDNSWLRVLAWEVYGVEAPEATYATPTVTLTNTGGGFYEIDTVGALIVRASSTGKTFHNTSLGTLASGDTVTFDLIADEAGADSSVSADEIDEIVTTMLLVEIDSSTAATASDEATPQEIGTLCDVTLGALSPNGPPDAYEAVVLDSDKTGVEDITRAATEHDSPSGEVTVYLAGSAGPVAGASVTAAQAAIATWATPLTITATAVNSTPVTKDVTATVSGDDIPAGFEDAVESALGTYFAALALGRSSGGGVVALSAIYATIHNTLVSLGASNVVVSLSLPAADDVLDPGEVAVLGVVTLTEA